MARTYVATGNQEYERQYYAVLDIRNGKMPRPVSYSMIYWDLVMSPDQKPCLDIPAVSLDELMIREGFTRAEFDKLNEAKHNSDDLVRVERIAMNAVKGLFADSSGNFTIKKKPDRELAIRLMNDADYHRTKSRIMRPINDFYILFEQRTSTDILSIEQHSENLILGIIVLISVVAGILLLSLIMIIHQIQKREQRETELGESEEKYRTLIETMTDGVYRSTHEGKFLEVNPALVKILGYDSKEELLAIDIKSQLYFSEEDRESADLEEMQEEMAVFRLRKKDGSEIWVEDHGRHVLDYEGNILFHEGVLRDVTDRLYIENEIRKLNESLEERVAERTKQLETTNKELAFHLEEIEQFTYIASHDLQEPLRTLTNFTQLIKEEYSGKLDDDGNKYIEFISKSADRMRALVTDILEYSLLGKESVLTIVDTNKIVGEVLSDLADSIKESNAEITVKELPVVSGYTTELRLLFQNLIVNAIKFQKKKVPPKIIISAESQPKEWIFSVEDNGIGINQKNNEKIFVFFKRMHNRNDYEGTGIGLSHC